MFPVLRCAEFQSSALANLFIRRYRIHATPCIVTLDHTKLRRQNQKVGDLSGRKIILVRFRTLTGDYAAKFRFHSTKDEHNITLDFPFPPHTRGVFYYHLDPNLPPISGGICFRLCDTLEEFDQGEDLHTAIGKPWKISLFRIAHTDGYKTLAQFLVEKQLVLDDMIEDLRQWNAPSRFTGLYLYHLSQPFVIDLEATSLMIHLVTRKTYSYTPLYSPLYNSTKFSKAYTGLAKVRFELSTWSEHKQHGPTLVLRILEFLSPPQRVLPDGPGPYIELVPDTFVMKRTTTGHIKPWGFSLENRTEGAKWKEFITASSS